ncbi:unnamed protein product [Haemonchus placei]|uniref:Uncharacterized protein n=1 Tax=Haemonchus placei TaxID=6290 RepID=A0A3P7Y6Z2_HAEPC|nr:unnamed protein product [Haemonchus placei]
MLYLFKMSSAHNSCECFDYFYGFVKRKIILWT